MYVAALTYIFLTKNDKMAILVKDRFSTMFVYNHQRALIVLTVRVQIYCAKSVNATISVFNYFDYGVTTVFHVQCNYIWLWFKV